MGRPTSRRLPGLLDLLLFVAWLSIIVIVGFACGWALHLTL